MEKILFKEEQHFRQIWIWLILVFLVGLMLWGIILQVILDIPFGNKPAPDWGLFLSFALVSGLFWLFIALKLTTSITSEAITVRFVPFYTRTILISDIQKAYIRAYRPIAEFGGWGYRVSHKGTALNVSGKIGLQLELKNGKKILIGTQKDKELEIVIRQLNLI